MTETPDIVARVREELIAKLQWTGPEAVAFVLLHVAHVSFRGDVRAYAAEVQTVMTAALTLALQPEFDKWRKDAARFAAENDRLVAQQEKFMREFEEFRLMKTPETIQ